MFCNWNGQMLTFSVSINWRASLVPAAAVIPAPIAYILVVAVKKLVVEFLVGRCGRPHGLFQVFRPSLGGARLALSCRAGDAHRLL